MELLDLPIDVLRMILEQTAVASGLYDAIKLRLVCSMPSEFIATYICSH